MIFKLQRYNLEIVGFQLVLEQVTQTPLIYHAGRTWKKPIMWTHRIHVSQLLKFLI